MKITLNLLPEEQKEYLRKQRIFGVVVQQVIYAFVLMLIFVGILFTVNMILGVQMDGKNTMTENRYSEKRYEELLNVHTLFKEVNRSVSGIDRAQKHHIQWAKLFAFLEDAIVEGVEYESVQTDGGKVTIIGFARSRDALTQQIESLKKVAQEESTCLIDVHAADDDLFKKNDFDFTITFTVNDQCIKIQ